MYGRTHVCVQGTSCQGRYHCRTHACDLNTTHASHRRHSTQSTTQTSLSTNSICARWHQHIPIPHPGTCQPKPACAHPKLRHQPCKSHRPHGSGGQTNTLTPASMLPPSSPQDAHLSTVKHAHSTTNAVARRGHAIGSTLQRRVLHALGTSPVGQRHRAEQQSFRGGQADRGDQARRPVSGEWSSDGMSHARVHRTRETAACDLMNLMTNCDRD